MTSANGTLSSSFLPLLETVENLICPRAAIDNVVPEEVCLAGRRVNRSAKYLVNAPVSVEVVVAEATVDRVVGIRHLVRVRAIIAEVMDGVGKITLWSSRHDFRIAAQFEKHQ